MANTYTVKSGDTLREIALKYYKSYGYTSYIAYQNYLAQINDLDNPNFILIGQVLKLQGTTTKKVNSTYRPTIKHFGRISNTDKDIFASWVFSKTNVDHYEVEWQHFIGAFQMWVVGSKSTVTEKYCIYGSTPTNYVPKVRFRVKPVAKTRKVNGKDTPYWTGQWSSYKEYNFKNDPPAAPTSAPTVNAVAKDDGSGVVVTATYNNIPLTSGAHELISVHFLVKTTDSKQQFSTTVPIVDKSVSYQFTLNPGTPDKMPKYRIAAMYIARGPYSSDWSPWSSEFTTTPATPKSGITRLSARSETSIRAEWSAVAGADSYELEYATSKDAFEGSDATTTISNITTTQYEKTGLTTGTEYFFRVRSKAGSYVSKWSGIVSAIIGTTPSAPTTWSSTTTAIVGEPLNLYWVHNTEDKSPESYADLYIEVDGVKQIMDPIKKSEDEFEKLETSVYSFPTSNYPEGTSIDWKVRTAGVTKVYGEYSITRHVDIYAKPTLELDLSNEDSIVLDTKDIDGEMYYVLKTFPFWIDAVAGPSTQAAIGYHVSVISESAYDTVDDIGNTKRVSVGEEIYSRHLDVSGALEHKMSPSDIDLENGMCYKVICTASMDSGLTVEETVRFTVDWSDIEYEPNAEVVIDEGSYSANIRPFCTQHSWTYYKTEYDTTTFAYTTTTEVVEVTNVVKTDLYTDDTGDELFLCGTTNGEELYCYRVQDENESLVEGITLSVYRREYDGAFTEIAANIANNGYTFVTDPHPSLDYARYRIVATSTATGAVSYSDIPGYPVGAKAVIIQWAEEWSSFDITSEEEMVAPAWSGSLLKLPYNVDVSNKHKTDVELVSYAGRKHPVSYYGTQLGETHSLSVEVDKNDKETLYALRRLSIWTGDVYVREPYGGGYWASISVSFNQKHGEVTVPVSIEITRVEGGI